MSNETPVTEAPKMDQRYANLCAQLGERSYFLQKISLEMAALSAEIDKIKKEAQPAAN